MRIEFVYAPGCNTYKKALNILETVIAEERLPIAIEMIEDKHSHEPTVRINGTALGEPSATFEGDPCFLSGTGVIGAAARYSEHLRNCISRTWLELTLPA